MNKNISQILWSIVGGGLVAGGIAVYQNNLAQKIIIQESPTPIQKTAISSKPYAYLDFTKAAASSIDAVVHVKVVAVSQKQYYDPFREFFYGDGNVIKEYKSQGAGSGVIISPDGYIVSNYHVIKGASEIAITLNNKENYTAHLVGSDPSTDLALLKIEGEGFQFLELADSDSVMVGEWALAVGNPFNLTSTVTAGIISATARNIHLLEQSANEKNFPVESFIQTDAAVNPGNSGGALINTDGKLIGINTAIASTTGAYAGYAFAIPSNLVKKTANDLKQFGQVQRAILGVRIKDIDDELKENFELKNKDGVYINEVIKNSAAYEAGLRSKDIILSVNQQLVKSSNELQAKIALYSPGDKIRITVIRDGATQDLEVELQNANGKKDKEIISTVAQELGVELKSLSSDKAQKLNLSFGVEVVDLQDGVFKSAGIKEGFVITHINDVAVRDINQFNRILKDKKGGVLVTGYYQKGTTVYYAIGL